MRFQIPQFSSAEEYYARYKDDDWRELALRICLRHGISGENLSRSPEGDNLIFAVDERRILKIFAPLFRDNFLREKAALSFCAGQLETQTPEILYEGEIENWNYLVLTRIEGIASRDLWKTISFRDKREIARQTGSIARALHSRPAAPLLKSGVFRDWREFLAYQIRTVVERQRKNDANPQWLERIPSYIEESINLLPDDSPDVFVHGDIHSGNLLLKETNAGWRIAGLIDFADSLCGFHEYEFLAPGVLMFQGKGELQREMLAAYGYRESEINESLRRRLMLLTILYEQSDLRKYALRLAPEAVRFSLDELERAIFAFAAD